MLPPGFEPKLGICEESDVYGSVHLGNMYVQLKVQLDVSFCVFFIFFILSSTCFGCYLHPSSGTQLQRTDIGVCICGRQRL
jgi:hypothetical protein